MGRRSLKAEFLSLLDPVATRFTFQTFGEGKEEAILILFTSCTVYCRAYLKNSPG